MLKKQTTNFTSAKLQNKIQAISYLKFTDWRQTVKIETSSVCYSGLFGAASSGSSPAGLLPKNDVVLTSMRHDHRRQYDIILAPYAHGDAVCEFSCFRFGRFQPVCRRVRACVRACECVFRGGQKMFKAVRKLEKKTDFQDNFRGCKLSFW